MGQSYNSYDSYPDSGVIEAETARNGARHIPFTPQPPREAPPEKPKEDGGLSVFWRVFGGTILSIVALIGITLYNHMASGIAELRGEINRLNEAKSELVKKDEYNSRQTSMWTQVQELQALKLLIPGMKEQFTTIGERISSLGKDNKESIDAAKTVLADLKERFAAVEQNSKQADKERVQLQTLQVAMTALQEKSINRDEQMKQIDSERKSMAQEIQTLRDRLTKVEVTREWMLVPATVPTTAPISTVPLTVLPQQAVAPPQPKSPVESLANRPLMPIIAPAMFAPRGN